MFRYDYIVTQPVFYLFVAFSCTLTIFFVWGRKENKRIFLSAFQDLIDVVKPDGQTITNIGGVVGYHANLTIKKHSIFSKIDATITLLPRHALLYLPISKMIMKFDRLFITLYLKRPMPGEAHLIEKKYANFRGPKITNVHRLDRHEIKWGKHDFIIYYERMDMRDHLLEFIHARPAPDLIRHIAIVPDQRKCFVFMIPQKGKVGANLSPIYNWIDKIVNH